MFEGDGIIAAHADAEIEFDLLHFERDEASQVAMLGNIAIKRGGIRTIERPHVLVPVGGPSVCDQVKAMSIALGEAADLTASRLAQ